MLKAEDLNEFQTHKVVNAKIKQPSNPYEHIFKACEEQKLVILHDVMNENIKKLLRLVRQNESGSNSTSKAQIYPLILNQNQLSDLPIYIKKLIEKLQESEADIFGRKTKDILIKEMHGTDVREILLDIYSDSQQLQGKPPFEFYVYIINDVTDLSEENLYIFSKGITNKNFVAFLPTYSTFDDQTYESILKLQMDKYMISIYDSKLVFCKYIYNCIKNPKIKAYLPPEVLSLVTDMDYYHLSYSQSCRRFNYCLYKALQLNPVERVQLDFDKKIEKIQSILRKKFEVKEHITNWFNIIKVILTQQQTYKISHSAISVQVSLRKVFNQFQDCQQQNQEDEFIQILNCSFRKNLQKNELAIFSPKEDQPSSATKVTRLKRKPNRIDELGINTKVQLTKKMKLENNITRVIKTLTKQVRKHAKNIKWSSFKFIQRIKPIIPLKLVNAMRTEDGYVMQLVEEITSHHFRPLSQLLSFFDEYSVGYGLYLIKTLELSGLFYLSKKQINPLAYNNFYQKTKFN